MRGELIINGKVLGCCSATHSLGKGWKVRLYFTELEEKENRTYLFLKELFWGREVLNVVITAERDHLILNAILDGLNVVSAVNNYLDINLEEVNVELKEKQFTEGVV